MGGWCGQAAEGRADNVRDGSRGNDGEQSSGGSGLRNLSCESQRLENSGGVGGGGGEWKEGSSEEVSKWQLIRVFSGVGNDCLSGE